MIKKIFTIFFFIFLNNFVYSQNPADSLKGSDTVYTAITGIIKTEKDSVLSGIQIIIKNERNNYSVKSDISGKYFIKTEPGKYIITVNHPGFNSYEFKNVNINKDEIKTLDIILIEKIVSTDEIEVEGTFRQRQDDLRTSVYNLNPQEVKALPGAVEDVLRSLQSLPGVSSPNDFTSQLVIRGSGPDQNLIIMDDVEIFNPYRLYGLVSMFNPETLSDITLITGGFPAKYGDRLSAVLDVTNKEGDRVNSLNGIINTSIANANVIFNGKNPFNIPGAWLVSSRRTYYDLIVGPFARRAKLITDDSSFPSFRDLQFKLVTGPFNKSSIILNGVFSNDGVDIIPGSGNESPDSIAVTDVTKNDMLALAWLYNPNKNFISRTTASWYRNSGDNDFNSELLDPLIDGESYTPAQRDSLRLIGAILGLQFDSKYTFRKYSIGNKSIVNNKNSQQEFGGGLDIVRTDLSYNLKVDDNLRAFINNFPASSAFNDNFYLEGEDNYRAYLYGQSMFKVTNRFFVQPSLRFDYFQIINTPYLAPRINIGYAVDPLTTIRSSVGVYYQSPGLEKLVDGRTFYDLRGANETGLKAEQAIHFIAGIDRWIDNQWLAKVEGYYKKFNDLIEQQELIGYRYEYTLKDPSIRLPEYIKDSENWIRSDEKLPFDSLTTIPVNAGSGNAYGFEISLERKYTSSRTKLYGWINYSLSFSNRNKYGVTYPYRFDQRNVANIVLNYRANNWLELGARWSYASNFPFTPPVGITPRLVNDSIAVNPITGDVIFNLDYDGTENLYSETRPAYHRLDIRATAYTNFWSANWAFYIDVINAYNRKNVLGYDYSLDENLILRRRTIGMFPILPTIGVNVKF
ncbi:MAG TPA: TonB-dependent receptor [Ignavibacteria bacterium]|nr:TonB-dependent receptor [Ignavibacteria bacterium]